MCEFYLNEVAKVGKGAGVLPLDPEVLANNLLFMGSTEMGAGLGWGSLSPAPQSKHRPTPTYCSSAPLRPSPPSSWEGASSGLQLNEQLKQVTASSPPLLGLAEEGAGF